MKTKVNKDQDHLNIIILSDAKTPDRTSYILDNKNENPYPYLLNDCKNYLYAIMIDMYYSTNICERVRNIRMYARMLSSCEEDLMKLYLIQEYFNEGSLNFEELNEWQLNDRIDNSTNYLETIIRDLIVLSSIKFRPDSDLTEVGYIKSDYTDNITESIESIIDNADDILRYKVYKEILSKNEVQKETSNSES